MSEANASDDHEVSVRLDWPVDPLAPPQVEPDLEPGTAYRAVVAPRADSHLDVVDPEPAVPRVVDPHHDLPGAIDEIADRLDQFMGDVGDALRALDASIEERITTLRTAMMSMLAAKQTDDQRTQRREREALMSSVAAEIGEISRTLTESMATSRQQTDVFADRVATELQALKRRIPVKRAAGTAGAIDDATMEELVTRLADEVEIRVAAALKPKPKPPRRKT